MNKANTPIAAGDVYSRLRVLEPAGIDKHHNKLYVCLCECGEKGVFVGARLRRGETKSCGCLHAEISGAILRTHGKSNTKAYKSWGAMMQRCYNTNDIGYQQYGGRGIRVSEDWHEFAKFYADMGDRPAGMTLDRKDPNGNYCKANCRWLEKPLQNRNRRDNRKFEYMGAQRTIPEIAEMVGLKEATLRRRLMIACESFDVALRPVKAAKTDRSAWP